MYDCPKSEEEREIDGKLDHEFWGNAEKADLKRNDGEPPAQQTFFQMIYTAEILYIGFKVWDVDIYATLTGRKAKVWQEEAIEVFLSCGDMYPNRYYEFQLSPNNVVRDLHITNRTGSPLEIDERWTCNGLSTAVKRHSSNGFQGWTAEMAIPFASLLGSYNADVRGTSWRINVFRIDRRPLLEYSAWSPTYQDTFHVPDRFGTLVFG